METASMMYEKAIRMLVSRSRRLGRSVPRLRRGVDLADASGQREALTGRASLRP